MSIMYVCESCSEHTPEQCGHFDRNELRVMPTGEWLCQYCYDDYYPEDLPEEELKASWSDFAPPPEYVAL